MFAADTEVHLRRWAADPGDRHVVAARHAVRFLDRGDVADLVAVLDDPHPCSLVDMMFAFVSQRDEVRDLVRTRLDAAANASRLVTIEASLAELMLVTPGCRPKDRTVATAVLDRADSPKPAKRH